MNIELRTIKAMAKEWRKRVNEEIEVASNKRDAAAKEENTEGFWYFKGYVQGLKYAKKEGNII